MQYIQSLLLASAVASVTVDNAVAITPGDPGGGRTYQSHSQPPAAEPSMQYSEPSGAGKRKLVFPNSAEEVKQALGIGPATRDMAALELADVGSFIQFEHNSDRVIPGHGLQIMLSGLIDLEAGQNIEIRGHTDSSGDAGYNLDLSRRRVNAVRNWLISNGVRADALHPTWAGESEPIEPNSTEEGKQKNRRVEFKRMSWR